jgi:hypothetical protein
VKCFMWQEEKAARYVICETGDIPLPRSLTRYARSFGCGERYRLTNGRKFPGNARTAGRRKKDAALPFFHRLRPLTSITKSDAQISGGETRQDYKDTRRFPWWLPRALSCSRHAASVLWWPLYLIHHDPVPFRQFAPSWTVCKNPRSVRPLRLIR